MSFSSKSYRGSAADYRFKLQSPPELKLLHERAQRVVVELAGKLNELIPALGDTHVTVGVSGHVQEQEGQQGDSLYVRLLGIAPEDAPQAPQEPAQAPQEPAQAPAQEPEAAGEPDAPQPAQEPQQPPPVL